MPRSIRADPGERYRFEVGHCGLGWIVDFDGSFWEVVRGGTGEPPSSLVNGDIGTIRLLDASRAEYTGSRGERVTLERIDGPIVPGFCA